MKKNIVFIISLMIVLSIVVTGFYSPRLLDSLSSTVHDYIITHFGWAYLLSAFLFILLCISLAFSKFGSIKLGQDHEKPEYSYFGWFSMLFAAGMGIGLIFWGVAEPLSHFMHPPEYITKETGDAAAFAMRYSFFHWGIQPWAIYIVMSLPIAYFSFRRGMPPLISSCFYPIWGEKIYGLRGYIIDTLAVIATIFGIATSLGLGAMQIGSGFGYVYGFPETITTTFLIIAVITLLFMITSILGIDKGIQLASKLNLILAAFLMLFLLVVGPTSYILNIFTGTFGEYANRFLEMSLQTNPFQGYQWTKSWTLFYWAWWISWAPFVGLFIARISKGRTIKEFILGAMIVPSALTFFWFSVFGGAGLHLQLHEGVNVAEVAVNNVSTALFAVLANYPLGTALSLLSIVLLVIFFVTSANSATFVLGMMTSNGSMAPPLYKKVVWGIVQSVVAAVLLLSGGLEALQKMNIAAALPFTIVMVLMCYNLIRALLEE